MSWWTLCTARTGLNWRWSPSVISDRCKGGGAPPPPLRMHWENQESDGHTGSRCLDKAVTSTKKNVVMSRRTHPKHDTAPVCLYIRNRTTLR